jgi:WS/DGAT/MGAT family acyltransferase
MSEQPERPKRVLIVSADMGEGHNATGRALEEAVRAHWPGATVRWVDTLDVMGRGVGPLFRNIYVTNVQRTPWLYEFFYSSLCRWPWFAASSKRVVGTWAGRRLARHLRAFRPDVVLSTYPLGTAGLDWLRKHRGLRTPVGAWVSDFAPHPFWVYRDIDLNLVMHQVAIAPANRWEPGAQVGVSAPPVVDGFAPGDRAAARRELDLPEDGFVALVSCGSLGFGSVESAAAALVNADPGITVVVACGRNEALRRRLLRGGDHDGRLRALGWTDQMPALTVACDVVVTNAGGATSLEALACGRTVLMYQPIAAHGRANAELMAAAGLAEVCRNPTELAATVRRLRAHPEQLAALESAALATAKERTVADGLDDLLAAAGGGPSDPALRRLRAEDALFVHIETPQVPQQLGAVLLLDPKPDGSPTTLADAADLLDAAPALRGRIVGGTAWRQPSWQPDDSIRAQDVVDLVVLGQGDTPSDLDGALDQFFSEPLDGRDGTGRARVVHGLEGGQSALLLKLHHAAADGIAVISSLVARCRGRELPAPPPAAAAPEPDLRQRVAAAVDLVRGVSSLARAGRAPRTVLDGPTETSFRHHARVDMAAAELRVAAKAMDTRTTDLAVALLAEALDQVLTEQGGDHPDTIRVMMPRSTRTTATFHNSGNHTGAASVDLPVGPMSLAERVRRTNDLTAAQVAASAPHAAHAVVWVLGVLPPWLHRRLARLVYRSTWFNAIASVLPGARARVSLHGATMTRVYPVLALAPGVGLSVGVMIWADQVLFCLTGNSNTAGTVDALAEALRAAYKTMTAESGRARQE